MTGRSRPTGGQSRRAGTGQQPRGKDSGTGLRGTRGSRREGAGRGAGTRVWGAGRGHFHPRVVRGHSLHTVTQGGSNGVPACPPDSHPGSEEGPRSSDYTERRWGAGRSAGRGAPAGGQRLSQGRAPTPVLSQRWRHCVGAEGRVTLSWIRQKDAREQRPRSAGLAVPVTVRSSWPPGLGARRSGGP